MRILFITDDFGGASLCARLHHEGHAVRAHVGNPVTGHGATVEEARQQACRRIENIVIPRMYYRADIGQSVIHATQSKLEQLGYL